MTKPIPDGQPMSLRTQYRRKKAAGLTHPTQPEHFNETIFDTWSDEMAWLLGVIWSDGCLFRNTIEVCSKDLQLIELVMAVIEGGRYGLKNGGDHLRVLFTSKHTATTLRSLGLTEKKSLTITWPSIPPEYEGAFLRGLIDGDGSVLTRQERPNQQVADLIVQLVTASPHLRDGIHDCFSRNEISHSLQVREPRQMGWSPLYRFAVVQQESLRNLFELLYPSDHVACLHRKRVPFEVWMYTDRPRNGRPKGRIETRERKKRERLAQAEQAGQMRLPNTEQEK